MKEEDFYIGWMPKASGHIKSFIKRYLIILLPLLLLAGAIITLSQKKFATGTFELGHLTEVRGIYFNTPVPCIKAISSKDIWGHYSYITIPLVGYGKHGADGIISQLEKENSISLHQKQITLKGALLYNDGKLLMQIDGNDKPLVTVDTMVNNNNLLPVAKEVGVKKIRGEIVDPKCYFGVMKPGEGKPHRDCAIRCILGGIPPVVKVLNEKGEANYYLIVGPNGERMNEAVKDYVAEPVEVEARVVQYDDWIVLYASEMNNIKRISRLSMIKPDAIVASCGNVCIK
jgi:hypothetical protein